MVTWTSIGDGEEQSQKLTLDEMSSERFGRIEK